jgi:competence protein ComEC
MQKPTIIPLTLSYIAGLLLGHGFLFFPCSIGILALLFILTAGILVSLHKFSLRRYLLMIVPGIFGAALYVYSSAWFPSDHYTRTFIPDNKLHELAGRITSPIDRDPDRTAFVLELSRVDRTPVSGKVRVSVREETAVIGYGDAIRMVGKIFIPRGFNNPGGFDYPAFLAQNNIFYTVSVKDCTKILILRHGSGIFRTIQNWRERIRQSILASTSGPGSAILQAMIIGEEGRLTDDLRDQFMAAGVTHIISISGSHLGMVAILCFGVLRSLLFLMPERYYHRLTLTVDPKKIAAWLTLPLVIFYTLLAGGQVATIRSLILISAGLLALILDRNHALMHALAIAALIILLANPQAIFDISFQLSYLSVLAIGYVVTFWNDLELTARNTLHKLRNNALLLVTISFSTSLATGPLVAHYFNQVSLAGMISNLIIVPFAGMVVVPLGLLSAILSLFLGRLPLAGINQIVCNGFVSVVAFFSHLPIAEFHPPAPGALWLMLYAIFLFSLGSYARDRILARFKPLERSSRTRKLPLALMTFSGTTLVLLLAFPFLSNNRTEISFPDVGQGDCALIQLGSGKTILIDGGGTYDNRFDIGRRVVAPYLWNRGVHTIDLVILSHPHPDHMNGLKFILSKFNVKEVWESALDPDLPGYEEFRKIIAERSIARKTVSAENVPVELGEAHLRVLHPSRTFTAHAHQAYLAENNRSLVVRITFDKKAFLFTGDIGAEAEQLLVRTSRDLKCDLLKVPHHGSNSSSSTVFLSKMHPEIAVVTCGRGNTYGHPSDKVLARYAHLGTQVRRTDHDGAVTVVVAHDQLYSLRENDLRLSRIGLTDRANWGKIEQINQRRLLIRASAL